VLDVAMAKVGLQRPRIVPAIGQRVPTRVPEYMGSGLNDSLATFPVARSFWRSQRW
jgi:hypothetical protein